MKYVQKISRTLNKESRFFTFVRAQFSSQVSSRLDFLTTIFCVNLLGMFYGNATLIGNILGGMLNCFINYKWTFKASELKIRHVLLKYTLVFVMSLFLNRQGTIIFTELVMVWIPIESLPDIVINNIFLVPKVVVSILVGLLWNFNMQRLFVYKKVDFKKYFRKAVIE